MTREKRERGYFVAFDCSAEAKAEIRSFQQEQGRQIVPMPVREILSDEVTVPLNVSAAKSLPSLSDS